MYKQSVQDLHERFLTDNVSLLAATTYSSDPTPQVSQIKASGARIMMSFVADSRGRVRPLCRVSGQKWLSLTLQFY